MGKLGITACQAHESLVRYKAALGEQTQQCWAELAEMKGFRDRNDRTSPALG
ncbi:MAG TPA: hypothetical protein VF060_10855 [Trebonia sp.]